MWPILSLLRQIVDRQKNVSSEILYTNYRVTKLVNNKINEIQIGHLNNLSEDKQKAAAVEYATTLLHNRSINNLVDSLDIDNPTTEPTETRLNRFKLEREIEASNIVENILQEVVRDLGPEYNRLKKVREYLDNRNNQLIEQHIDLVNKGIEIDRLIEKDNGGSLVEDYADTSAEMPSYMNPED